MRPPVVAGLEPGVGVSTLAAALHGVDGGRWTGGPVDVLVVGRGVDPAAVPPGVPVLVLRAEGPASLPGRSGAVVVVPEVPQWRGPDGLRAAAGLLRHAQGEQPAGLRPAAEALVAVIAALVASGVLERPSGEPEFRPMPVLLHRAGPPRIVAGRPLRVSGAPPSPPASSRPDKVPPAGGRRTLRLAPVPADTPPVRTGEPDDDTLEGEAASPALRILRTG